MSDSDTPYFEQTPAGRGSHQGAQHRSWMDWAQQADLLALALSIIVIFFVATLGSLATEPALEPWYANLNKPVWNPPNLAFPIAWSILYPAMAVAAWMVWRKRDEQPEAVQHALAIYAGHLVFNIAWSWAFFGMQSPALGLVAIIPLLGGIVWTWLAFKPLSTWAGHIFLPYIAWASFATALNIAIWWMN